VSHSGRTPAAIAGALAFAAALAAGAAPRTAVAEEAAAAPHLVGSAPKIVLISLDGAKPDLIQTYLRTGVLPGGGLGYLRRRGVYAQQNVTATPSLTAVSHLTIATGSTAVHTDTAANSFHLVAAPITTGVSGFASPIGGYDLSPLGPEADPTAEPMWVRLRAEGKHVVTATWPGADGADIAVNGTLVQGANPTRITDYTVPFGAFGGLGATGFSLAASDFVPDQAVADQLAAAGRTSFSPVRATPTPFETFYCASAAPATCSTAATLDLKFEMRAAALDTTNDNKVNYDTLAFFEKTQGITAGPFAPPSTGPAYVKRGGPSAPFFFEGSGSKVGAAYFVSFLAKNLSTVRFVRYGANFIPRNAPVLSFVDDINNNVGFWRPQPDFRIPERLSPGFTTFPDLELEAAYEDQVTTFLAYQTRLAQHAIVANPGADLVMIYIEEPDGSGHQFTLTTQRQATDPRDPTTIGGNQDRAKIARYSDYVKYGYKRADKVVADIISLVGHGTDIFVVSDHGMAPFHTAVNMTNLLKKAGVDTSLLGIRTNGPVVNIYVNLQGREAGGTVDAATYQTLVAEVADAVKKARDTNATFNYGLKGKRVFATVASRPTDCPGGGRLLQERPDRAGLRRRLRRARRRLQL
jgi:hypothetical protein